MKPISLIVFSSNWRRSRCSRRDVAVALRRAGLDELDEVVERVAAVGRVEARQEDPVELDLDVAPLGHLERAPHRVVEAGEVERHLLRRLEVEVVGLEFPVVRVLERVARLDAEQRLVGARVLGAEVVDVARRDGRQVALAGERDELGHDPRLHVEVRVLELDVDLVAAEDLLEPVELGLGVVAAALLERLAHAAGEAARERDQPGAVRLEELPVDARLVVVALEIAERREADEVRVALVRLREQREVRLALLLRVAVVGDVDLAADERLHALLARRLVEVDRAGERAVVGEPDRRHVELGGALREVRDPARPVEDRVLRVDVEVNEGRFGHGSTNILLALDDARQRARLRL